MKSDKYRIDGAEIFYLIFFKFDYAFGIHQNDFPFIQSLNGAIKLLNPWINFL